MRVFIAVTLLVITFVFGIDYFLINKANTERRAAIFHSTTQILKTIDTTKVDSYLTAIYLDSFNAYSNKISSLYSNVTFCLLMSILAIIVVRRKRDIEVPGFSSIRIPIQVSYLVVPAALCYYWIQFGFFLHDIVALRIELMKIIQVNYLFQFKISNVNQISFVDYFTYTPYITLKDTGFVDSWFLFFFPSYLPTTDLGFGSHILPGCTMVLVGILYGTGQGFAIGLPYNWLFRYHNSEFRWRIFCSILLIIIFSLIIISHFTFYFGVKNYNWMHVPIFLAMNISFYVVTRKDVRDHYQTITDED